MHSYINSKNCLPDFHLQTTRALVYSLPCFFKTSPKDQNHHFWCLLDCKELLIHITIFPTTKTMKQRIATKLWQQKIVIKVTGKGAKSRSKALQIAVGLSGVESAALGGQDKSQIEVVGDGVDAVHLANLLRKKVGSAELATVEAVGEKKEEKKEEPAVQAFASMYGGSMPQTYIYPVHPYQDPSCSIM